MQVRNIGDSAAFNVELGAIAIPPSSDGPVVRLSAKPIFDLNNGETKAFEHTFEVNGFGNPTLSFPARNFTGQVLITSGRNRATRPRWGRDPKFRSVRSIQGSMAGDFSLGADWSLISIVRERGLTQIRPG